MTTRKSAFVSVLTLIAALLSGPGAHAYFGSPGKQVKVAKSQSGGSPYGYLEYLPAGYSDAAGAAKVPIIVFLHGVGEMGDGENNTYINNGLNTGLPKLIQGGKQLPAIVVSPQTPVWWNSSTIDQFVNFVFATYKNADVNRLYVTGLSMGGGGTWDYAASHANRVAAIVPICGASQGDRKVLYGKGVWAFHAWDDPTVNRSQTIYNINSITPSSTDIMTGYPSVNNGAAASDMTMLYSNNSGTHQWITGETVNNQSHDSLPRFSMYKNGGHGVWNKAYSNQDMWNWLFTFTNNNAPVPGTPTPTPKPATPTPTPKPATPTPTPKPSTPTPVPPGPVAFTSGSITVDFGSMANGTKVNNRFADSLAHGGAVANLVNQNKASTTVGLSVIQGFNGLNQNGTNAPASSLGLDAGAASDSFFGNDVAFGGMVAPAATLALSGLDPNRLYELRFFASRMSAGGDNRETRYQATGKNSGSAVLNVSENTSQIAVVGGIQPNANGTISLDVRKGSKNNNAYGFYYLGAMTVIAQGAASTPTPTPAPQQQEIRVDFGNSAALPAGWNSGQGLSRSGSVSLKTASNAATSISLVNAGAFNGVNANGSNAPASALALPAIASQDSFFGNDVIFNGFVAPKGVLELRGLDKSKTYSLEFYGSRMATDSANRDTLYRSIGATTVTANLNVTNNSSKSVKVSLKPNASGVIRIEVQKGASNNAPNGFYYLGNLRIRY